MSKKIGYDVTKDSGNRRKFETGAVRDMASGKGRFDLLPYWGLLRVAKLYERGAVKYSPNNWRKGIPLHVYADSGDRHLHKATAGLQDEDHIAAWIWNALGFADTEEMIRLRQLSPELNQIWNYEIKPATKEEIEALGLKPKF